MIASALVARALRAFADQPWYVACACLVAALACQPTLRRAFARPLVWRVAAAVVVGLGVAWAWSLCWASDDAYITFRYAANLAHGHGLVFNPGERVEGYTDFLWAVLLSGFIWVGAPPGETGILLSLASFIALLLLTWSLADRLGGPRTVPLALLLTATNYTVASFATAGLETVFAAMWVLAALAFAQRQQPLLAGLAGVFATLAHPDHLLFAAALGAALLWSTRSPRVLVRYGLPFVLLLAPYFLWRWRYYGDLLPNTYYAKSGGDAYFSQGGIYLLVSVIGQGVLVALPLALVGLARSLHTLTGRFVLLGVPLYVTYVAKIGGDFMLGRLLTPVFPLVFIMAEAGLRQWLAQRRSAAGAFALTSLAALGLAPVHLVAPGEIYAGIADERTFTPVTRFWPIQVAAHGFQLGQALHAAFTSRGLSPTVAVWSLGMTSYYSQLPTFDLRGLTSRSVAHQPLLQRGRPGHEKVASVGQVLEAGVDLSMLELDPQPYAALTRFDLEGTQFSVARYQPSLVAVLRARGLVDYAVYLDQKTKALPVEPARLDCDLWHLRDYYFSVNDDGPRREALVASLAAREMAFVAPLVLEPGDPATRGWSKVNVLDFDALEGWGIEGDANGWRTTASPPNQVVPFGQRGAFIDSFTGEAGDGSVGLLRSPTFELTGDALTLEVGGGLDPQVAVNLVVDGVVVRTATGCNSERLGRRAWDVRGLRGRLAQVTVVDRARGGWGHLLVDEVVQWRAP